MGKSAAQGGHYKQDGQDEPIPSLPVLDPLENMEAGIPSSEVALEKFIESRAHFATAGKLLFIITYKNIVE